MTAEITPSSREIMVSIKDSGSGVPEWLQRNIFDDFARADERDDRKARGTGLGLPIARSLIEKFGGNISFYNLEPTGSVFYFTLPVASAEQ